MQSFSKASAAQTSRGAYGQFRQRWLHGSLRQASIRAPGMVPMIEGDAFAIGEALLEVESDAWKPVDPQDNYFNSLSISVSSPSPSTPTSERPCLSANFVAATTLCLLPSLFSPLTPTMTPRTPSFLGKHWYKGVPTSGQLATLPSRLRPGLLELDFSTYPTSPFPPSATIPSPFRRQLQEDVATTPLPSTPLTARWPGSAILVSTGRLQGH